MRTTRTLKAVSVVEALEDELAGRIFDGDFAAGEYLREIELSEQYRVGRHTLRAAFDGLVRHGLLDRARNRGVFVPEFTAEDLVEIYGLRTAFEVEAFRIVAARRTVPPGAREALAQYAELNERSPRRLVVEADLGFHNAIVAGAHNERLTRAHAQLQGEVQLCIAQLGPSYATVSELGAQHGELLDAIETGKPAVAEAAIRAHLEGSVSHLLTTGRGTAAAADGS
jgi:DNA-binding GntR family transcriptional regulator